MAILRGESASANKQIKTLPQSSPRIITENTEKNINYFKENLSQSKSRGHEATDGYSPRRIRLGEQTNKNSTTEFTENNHREH